MFYPEIQSQPKVFSAGLDILDMYGKSPEHCAEFWKAVQEMWLKFYGSDMITIAAVNVRINDPAPTSTRSAPHTRTEWCILGGNTLK